MRPRTPSSSPARTPRMQKLLDVLEDLDDVQDVYHNAEIEPE
jgi:transcriptional/translational regulatory protein YebC/TACO1